MLKKLLSAVFCAMVLLCAAVSAEDFKFGDVAYVTGDYSLPLTDKPVSRGSEIQVSPGSKIRVLQAYVEGSDKTVFHKIVLSDGTSGYIWAYVNGEETLVGEETFSNTFVEAPAGELPQYPHMIDMDLLKDYIYGGIRSQSGNDCDSRKWLPKEWRMHECPTNLPVVATAIVHIGDNGKEGYITASFVPGETEENYHERRLADLKAAGYDPLIPYEEGEPNLAFYCMTTDELKVVAYDEEWVAVWSLGGIETNRGMNGDKLPSMGIQYASWRSGVYFLPRKNCYILEKNNEIDYIPETQGRGKATAKLMIKTTPDSENYVEAGVYKTNQTFQVVNAVPQNGHYQIYYENGLYYVDAKYVNLHLKTVKKPLISHIAAVKADGAAVITDASGNYAAEAKSGTAIDIIEKNYGGSGIYSKIWFNSQECFIQTEFLTDFQSTPSASGLAQLGASIGTVAVDTVWNAAGQTIYTPDELALLQKANYGHTDDFELRIQLVNIDKAAEKLAASEWANVYKVEDFSFYDEPSIPELTTLLTGKIYTIVHESQIRYIVQLDNQKQAFTYYPGDGFSKRSVANTQPIYIDDTKYDALAYNINGNNYFKLRDLAKMLDGTVKRFEIEYDEATNSIDMLSLLPYTAVGGELTPGDGVERTAYASTAFLTYDGMPINATCYNIEGNNYYKLRDITAALDCRVEWDEQTEVITVKTTLPAKFDPEELWD